MCFSKCDKHAFCPMGLTEQRERNGLGERT